MSHSSEKRNESGEVSLRDVTSLRALFWILEIGGWSVFGGSMFVAGLSNDWTLAFTAVNKVSLTLLGFALSLAMWRVYLALERRGLSMPIVGLLAIPTSFVCAALWMAGHRLILAAWGARVTHRPEIAFRDFPDFTNTIYYFFLLLAWSALYFGARAYLDLLAERERAVRIEMHAQEARLRALRFQLNPHFLFNTLNAISTLIREARNDEANRMLTRLADFLRATLDGDDATAVTLDQEIAFATRYLDIETVRFGDRLTVDCAVESGLSDARVPPMILQPLVENAVHHAIREREEGGRIAIAARRHGNRLRLSVEDDGAGIDDPDSISEGVGLSNVRKRLEEIYGGDASLGFERGRMGGLRVALDLPLRSEGGGA